jgi:hypothetical protein
MNYSTVRCLSFLAVVLSVVGAPWLEASASDAPAKPEAAANSEGAAKAIRVLVVGNSQCPIFVGGKFLEKLAASDKGARPIEVINSVKGGASLKSHWEAGDGEKTARGLLASSKPDFVLLQDIYNVQQPAFQPYAQKFHALATEHKVQPIFFGTASIISDYPKGFERLHKLHVDIARELNVPIVDASAAYFRYFGDAPSKEKIESLFAADKAHPGVQGSYMYACMIYSALTGRSPIGLAAPDAIPADVAKALQETAWAQHEATLEEVKRK